MSRPMTRAKDIGTAWETAGVRYLRSRGLMAHRKALTGAKDEGDIDIQGGWILEAKNCRQLQLSVWMDEADAESEHSGRPTALLVKRRNKAVADAFVVMSFECFVDNVIGGTQPIQRVNHEALRDMEAAIPWDKPRVSH